MAKSLVQTQSSLEFFKEHVEAACARQRLHPQPLTTYYVVSLLSEFARFDGSPAAQAMNSSEGLGIRLLRALQTGGAAQRTGLRQVGDVSLFISGFFSDSLRRSLVDVDYYVSLGGYAYRSLGVIADDSLSTTFSELSDNFVQFVDVLSDVSASTALTNDSDLLRLYDQWVRTGSRRSGDLLAKRGLVPNPSASKRVQ